MKLIPLGNIRTIIRSIILPNQKKSNIESGLLQGLNLEKISLENIPITDEFKKKDYLQLISELENDVSKSNFANCFLRENPINEKSYAKLSPEELLAVRAQLKPHLIENAQNIITVSKVIKNIFDVKYGEGQYIFVSIGRSLSALANCLEFLGIETRHIPISGCREKVNTTVNTILHQEGFAKYKDFLERNLQQHETNKRFIFCDYVYTGTTLKVFKTLLNHRNVRLGTKKDVYIGINKLLINFKEHIKDGHVYDTISSFNYRLHEQRFDEYAEVQSLNFKQIQYINDALIPEHLRSNKLLKFCMLDILKNFE